MIKTYSAGSIRFTGNNTQLPYMSAIKRLNKFQIRTQICKPAEYEPFQLSQQNNQNLDNLKDKY